MYRTSILEDYSMKREEKNAPLGSPSYLFASLMLLIIQNLIEASDCNDSSPYVLTDNIALDYGATTNYDTSYRSWVTDRNLAYSAIEIATSLTSLANQPSSYLLLTPAYSIARFSR